MDRREMQNRCLARLATQLNRLGSGGAEVFFPTARAALQQILEDLLPGKAERLGKLTCKIWLMWVRICKNHHN